MGNRNQRMLCTGYVFLFATTMHRLRLPRPGQLLGFGHPSTAQRLVFRGCLGGTAMEWYGYGYGYRHYGSSVDYFRYPHQKSRRRESTCGVYGLLTTSTRTRSCLGVWILREGGTSRHSSGAVVAISTCRHRSYSVGDTSERSERSEPPLDVRMHLVSPVAVEEPATLLL